MIVRRSFLFAVTVTFSLIACLLMVRTTGSQSYTREYDAWVDINGDGHVSIDDIYTIASYFGTSGNPTKSVYVMNWPSTEPEYQIVHVGRFNITSGRAYYFDVPDWNNPLFVAAYDRFSVFYEIWDMSLGNYDLTISVAAITWIIPQGPYTMEPVNVAECNVTRDSHGWTMTHPTPNMIEVKGPYFCLEFRTDTDATNWSSIWVAVNVYVYMRNE